MVCDQDGSKEVSDPSILMELWITTFGIIEDAERSDYATWAIITT
jgi:hypothetical protein